MIVHGSSRFLARILALSILMATGFVVKAQAQDKGSCDAFTGIPASVQPQLKERLNLFVKFLGAGLWNEMYDLSIELIERKDITREEFVKIYQTLSTDPSVSTLLEFTPRAATLINEYDGAKEWLIEGCAKYRRSGQIVSLKASLNATLHDNNWYFSHLSPTTQVDGPELPCKDHKVCSKKWRRKSSREPTVTPARSCISV